MFELEVFRKQMCRIEELLVTLLGLFDVPRSHLASPIVIFPPRYPPDQLVFTLTQQALWTMKHRRVSTNCAGILKKLNFWVKKLALKICIVYWNFCTFSYCLTHFQMFNCITRSPVGLLGFSRPQGSAYPFYCTCCYHVCRLIVLAKVLRSVILCSTTFQKYSALEKLKR